MTVADDISFEEGVPVISSALLQQALANKKGLVAAVFKLAEGDKDSFGSEVKRLVAEAVTEHLTEHLRGNPELSPEDRAVLVYYLECLTRAERVRMAKN